MSPADKRFARKARKGYAEIIAEFELKKKFIEEAANRLLTPEEAQAKLDSGENPLAA